MAVPTMLETSRSHTATGAFGGIGGQITAATNATPIVITTTSAHGLADGDQVTITGITTNTAANGTFFVKRTSYTATTFGLYSDAALATGVAGNGTAGVSAASIVSQSLPISSYTGDWTVKVRVESLTAAKNVLIGIDDSVDGITWVTRASVAVKGQVLVGAMRDALEIRSYDNKGIRFGTSLALLRINILAIDANTTAVITAWIET